MAEEAPHIKELRSQIDKLEKSIEADKKRADAQVKNNGAFALLSKRIETNEVRLEGLRAELRAALAPAPFLKPKPTAAKPATEASSAAGTSSGATGDALVKVMTELAGQQLQLFAQLPQQLAKGVCDRFDTDDDCDEGDDQEDRDERKRDEPPNKKQKTEAAPKPAAATPAADVPAGMAVDTAIGEVRLVPLPANATMEARQQCSRSWDNLPSEVQRTLLLRLITPTLRKLQDEYAPESFAAKVRRFDNRAATKRVVVIH